jgi:hypothetical protein
MPDPGPVFRPPETPFSAPINAGSADNNVPAVAGTSGKLLGQIFEGGGGIGVVGLSGSGVGVQGNSGRALAPSGSAKPKARSMERAPPHCTPEYPPIIIIAATPFGPKTRYRGDRRILQ